MNEPEAKKTEQRVREAALLRLRALGVPEAALSEPETQDGESVQDTAPTPFSTLWWSDAERRRRAGWERGR